MRHRQAIDFVIIKTIKDKALCDKMLNHAKDHDMDKVLLYTLIDKKTASAYHKQTSFHHAQNNLPKTKEDLIEGIMDWESSAYTKPDKPLNAYNTLNHFLRNHKDYDNYLAIMHELNIDRSYQISPSDPDWIEFAQKLPEITEETILTDIYSYIARHPDETNNLLHYVKHLK